MTFLKEDLDKIVQAIKKLANSGQEISSPEQEVSEPSDRTYLSDNLILIAQAIRDLNENNEITVEKSIYLTENLNEIAKAIEDLDINKNNYYWDFKIAYGQDGNQILDDGNIEFLQEIVLNISKPHIIAISPRAFEQVNPIITEINITSPITALDYVFRMCAHIKKISLTGNIKTITGSFHQCYKLKTLILGNTIEEIKEGSFTVCNSLKTLKLPKSLKILSRDSFYHCQCLKTIDLTEFNANNIPTITGGGKPFQTTYARPQGGLHILFSDQNALEACAQAEGWCDLYAEQNVYFEVAQQEE